MNPARCFTLITPSPHPVIAQACLEGGVAHTLPASSSPRAASTSSCPCMSPTILHCRKAHLSSGRESTFQERNLRRSELPRPPTDDHYEELPPTSPRQTAAEMKRIEAGEKAESALDDTPPGDYDSVYRNTHYDDLPNQPESATAEQEDDIIKAELEDELDKVTRM